MLFDKGKDIAICITLWVITDIINSKKDPEVRAKEILNEASPLLIDTVAKKAPVLMREKLSSQVVQEILLHATGTI